MYWWGLNSSVTGILLLKTNPHQRVEIVHDCSTAAPLRKRFTGTYKKLLDRVGMPTRWSQATWTGWSFSKQLKMIMECESFFSCRDLQAEAASITVMKTVSSFVNVHLWQLGRSIWLPYPVLCHQRSWSSGSMKVPRVNGFNDISMTWFADAMAVIGSDDTIFLDPGVKQVIACRLEPVSPSFCTPADCGRSCDMGRLPCRLHVSPRDAFGVQTLLRLTNIAEYLAMSR